METITIGKYKIKDCRARIPKFIGVMKANACRQFSDGATMEEVYRSMYSHLKEIGYKGPIYVSYTRVNEWNKRESLRIRNANGDYTLVSIISVS
jgi:hypothetical protein